MDGFRYSFGGSSVGECVKLLPLPNGSIRTIVPDKNAVIVQLIDATEEGGPRLTRRIFSVECKDEAMYPLLMAEAIRISSGK